MRTDSVGQTQLLVEVTNVPPPAQLGAGWYTALFAFDGSSFEVPLVEAPGTGVWAATTVQSLPAQFFAAGSANIYPGPVLGGLVANCR
jgi:hypothetical protein